MELGSKIKQLRHERGWSQAQLAMKAGLTRSHISLMELRDNTHPRTDVLIKLATVFNVPIELLYEAAGYKVSVAEGRRRIETHEEILERLKIIQPVSVPVYTTFPFHAGEPMEPIEYIYRARSGKRAGKNIEGYIVQGDCMSPIIQNGDIIIVDREANIESGDIVACQAYEQLFIGKLTDINGELWLVNSERQLKYDNCQAGASVIEVIKRLK